MTLRVYLRDNNGWTDFIDYGINAENYQSITKVELREETSKVKDILGVIEIKTPKRINTLTPKTNLKNYEIFDSQKHDTDTEFYLMSVLCNNCNDTSQIAIKKGESIQSKKLHNTTCPKCNLIKTLRFAKWNGHEYKVTKK